MAQQFQDGFQFFMNFHVLFLVKRVSPSFCLCATLVSFIHCGKWIVEIHVFRSVFQKPLKWTAAHGVTLPSQSLAPGTQQWGDFGLCRSSESLDIFPTFQRGRNPPSQTSFKSLLGVSTTHAFPLSTHLMLCRNPLCVPPPSLSMSSGWVDAFPQPSASVPVNVSFCGMSE